ncbi:hypothetical protein EDD79_102729 [Serpentinicella alkaliphila]|uniref:PsbP protein n=1 Tax=Serpentinicella alkaliphila TaxID=1734049 RepID=A0A4R2TV45_9FIRM|nr:hypothetical protein EDD79_102729 [Serpentinicella alkaliphila]
MEGVWIIKKAFFIIFVFIIFSNVLGCRYAEETNSNNKKYMAANGWSILYPSTWDRVEDSFIQETSTGQIIQFSSERKELLDLFDWIDNDIEIKLSSKEASNSLFEPVRVDKLNDITIYEYTVQSDKDGITRLLKTTIFYDGNMMYEFYGALPDIEGEIYEAIINSFKLEQ